MTRKVLITGGQGFVGRALVDRFADQGHEVTCGDLATEAVRDDVRFRALDIRDRDAVGAAAEGMDTVIHNASMVHTKHNREEDVWAVNLTGTQNIVDACEAHAVSRLVYISSASAVYEGKDIENGDESLPYARISQAPYADSKIAAERKVLAFSGTETTQACAIRPHVVFGPGDSRFIPAVLDKAQEGKLGRAIGNRDKLSDFTYISNLVDAVVAAEARLAPGGAACGQPYFVTNGEPMVWFDFVEKLLVELGYPPITGRVPYWVAYAAATIAETIDTLKGGTVNAENGLTRFAIRYMVTHHYFSIAKARRELEWTPAVSLEEGIRLTADHLHSTQPSLAGNARASAA